MIHVDDLAHSNGLRKVPRSDFSTVVDNGGDAWATELAIGYAPFLLSKSEKAGGRTYTPDENQWVRFAPYFGVGVLSSAAGGTGVDWLRSLYFGVEYELTPGTSLAVAGVLRRTDALANGLSVGMAVDPSVTKTHTLFGWGLGAVFNVTPSFFQFAASAMPKQ